MSKRKQRLRQLIGGFLHQYGRKADANHDPNDRSYSREIESLVKRMSPEEFDELVNGSDDDTREGSDKGHNQRPGG